MLRLLLALALVLPACADDAAEVPALPTPTPVSDPATVPTTGRLAVVELFTSEGCSSCPPADAVLADLAGRPDVVALSFHVDYWDELGWRDPFSSAWATARQRAYASGLDGRVYTPEMVVGGTAAFVGSRRDEARTAIAAALGTPAPVTIALEARHSGTAVEASVSATGLEDGQVVHVALVQREAESRVVRGENRGRTLRHAHVVRAFETVAGGAGRATLPLPEGLDPSEALVVAFAQQGETGAIVGAATAEVR